MHGRIKVKTTAEQQEAKRKEREKKLQLYSAATEKAFEKRKKKEYDEEALKVTGEILHMNSDFYSLWNFRKDIFLHLVETRSKDDMQAMFADELLFLEACLRRNPKSYGVWNHRCFVMATTPVPDWKQELQLCNLFLQYDERNFHCWDYRRFIVRQSGVSPEAELEYTTDKICNNFSNFSSWHYRSKLLPLVYPDEESPVGVNEDMLIKEFETVQNAFFTDPDDQSAWFYHRWLLGRGKMKPGVSCIYVSREEQVLVLTTVQPIKISPSCEIVVSINGNITEGVWCSHSNMQDIFSCVWLYSSADSSPLLPVGAVEVMVSVDDEDWGSSDTVELAADQADNFTLTQGEPGSRFSHELSAATSSTLERELESILQLFEIEPENKWVLLTIVSLMKALDPLKYADAIRGYIDQLLAIDPYRLGYYKDLRSRYVIENFLEEYDYHSRVVSLANQGLTTLYHPELLSVVVHLDLSNNCLSSVKHFSCLQCVKELNLDNNHIEDLTELSFLKQLAQLTIKNNWYVLSSFLNNIPALSTRQSIQCLHSCRKLTVLNIQGNKVAEQLNETYLAIILPGLAVLDGVHINVPTNGGDDI